MRHFQVPQTITIHAPPDIEPLQPCLKCGFQMPLPREEKLTFRKFATICWLNDRRAVAGGFTKQVRWASVIQAFTEALPGAWISLEDEDYATLKAIVEAPEQFLPPLQAAQCLPFSQAVLGAIDKLPATQAANGKDKRAREHA